MTSAATLPQETPMKPIGHWLEGLQAACVQYTRNKIDQLNAVLEVEQDPRVRSDLVLDKLVLQKRIQEIDPLSKVLAEFEIELTKQHDPIAAEALAQANYETLPVEECPASLHPAAQLASPSLDDIADEVESAEIIERASAAKRVVTEEATKTKPATKAESIVVEAAPEAKPVIVMDAETMRLYSQVFGSIPKRLGGKGARP